MAASNFCVLDIIHFRNICKVLLQLLYCSFSILTRDSHKISFPPCPDEWLPQVHEWQKKERQDCRLCSSGFPNWAKARSCSWGGGESRPGGEQAQKCLEFALEKYTAAVNRIAQCSACVVCSVCERDRMWGTTKGIRWGESLEKQFWK